MKKTVLLFLLCLLGARGISQENYTIEFVGVDRFLTNTAKKCIQENTPPDNRHYAFTLTQDGAILSVNCKVTPDDFDVTEQTNDAWSELEQTIIKAIDKTKPSLVSNQVTPTNINPTQPVIQQQTSQTYQQPIIQQQPPTYQQPQQPYQQAQPQYQASNNANPYNGMGYSMVQNYTLNDVAAGKATIGGRICFPDGSCGIIFYLDGMGHGLAVSLDQTKAKWQNAKKTKECQDIYQLINESDLSKYCSIGLGYQNTMAIINQLGMGQAPAAEWCVRHGEGWYLPSGGELWNLLMVANYLPQDENQKSFFKRMFNKKNYSDGFISIMLQAVGGHPLTDDNWYWTSSEEGQGEAYNISISGRNGTADKFDELSVRAVRYF